MEICGISDPSKHYFVDDSMLNVKGATEFGWHAYLFDEDGHATYEKGTISGYIRSILELRQVWSQFFKVQQQRV